MITLTMITLTMITLTMKTLNVIIINGPNCYNTKRERKSTV
jgi:hypothetical protein